jgi:hypothetical protein
MGGGGIQDDRGHEGLLFSRRCDLVALHDNLGRLCFLRY